MSVRPATATEAKTKRGPIDKANKGPSPTPGSKTQLRKKGKAAHMKGDLSPRDN